MLACSPLLTIHRRWTGRRESLPRGSTCFCDRAVLWFVIDVHRVWRSLFSVFIAVCKRTLPCPVQTAWQRRPGDRPFHSRTAPSVFHGAVVPSANCARLRSLRNAESQSPEAKQRGDSESATDAWPEVAMSWRKQVVEKRCWRKAAETSDFSGSFRWRRRVIGDGIVRLVKMSYSDEKVQWQ